MAFCGECGTASSGGVFCSNCGRSVGATNAGSEFILDPEIAEEKEIYKDWLQQYQAKYFVADTPTSEALIEVGQEYAWLEYYDGTNQYRYVLPAEQGALSDDAEGFYVMGIPFNDTGKFESITTEREILCPTCFPEGEEGDGAEADEDCESCSGAGYIYIEFLADSGLPVKDEL